MKNVMVCVTQQKNCERLIKYGHDYLNDADGELFVIHVAHYQFKFLGIPEESEALEYLYEKALAYGANLTVVRSNSVTDTLADLVEKYKITDLILGASGESSDSDHNVVNILREKTEGRTNLVVIPSDGK